MGKAQSKRSVDITTDVKKGTEEEVTEKLEKIEDVDQKQVNGDASTKELNEAEKKDSSETEHDKDLTTEKSPTASEENAEQNTGAGGDTPNDGENKESAGATEEIAPLADESIKKSKKEKVKKKWSFRSISFGKKDKQKPAKNEESTENAAPVANGESEKADAENDDSVKVEKSSEVASCKPDEICENGQASEKEMNGQQSPTPTDEKKCANETITATAAVVASAISSTIESNGTAIENNQTEPKEDVEMKSTEVTEKPDSEKNGIDITAVINDTPLETVADKVTAVAAETVATANVAIENNKAIPSELNDGHATDDNTYQNGTNGESNLDGDVEPIQSQIEVNIDSKNTAETDLITTTTTTNTNTNTHTITTNPPESTNTSNFENTESQTQNETEFEKSVDNEVDPLKSSITENRTESNIQFKSEIESECQMQEPPPLPVSPPPSKVSVFAFNNDNLESIPQVVEAPTPSCTDVLAEKKSDASTSIGDIVEPIVGNNECSAPPPNEQTETSATELHSQATPKETDIVMSLTELQFNSLEQQKDKVDEQIDDCQTSQSQTEPVSDSVPSQSTAPEIIAASEPVIETELKLDSQAENFEVSTDEKNNSSMGSSIAQTMMASLTKMEEVQELCEKLIEESKEVNDEISTDCAVSMEKGNLAPLHEETENNDNNTYSQEDSQAETTQQASQSPLLIEVEKMDLLSLIESSIISTTTTIASPLLENSFTGEQNGNNIDQTETTENMITEIPTTTTNTTIDTHDDNVNENANMKLSIENLNNANDIIEQCTMQIENLKLNEDAEENLNTATKNIVNAKDLKENAAAEIIAQDISVTNE